MASLTACHLPQTGDKGPRLYVTRLMRLMRDPDLPGTFLRLGTSRPLAQGSIGPVDCFPGELELSCVQLLRPERPAIAATVLGWTGTNLEVN